MTDRQTDGRTTDKSDPYVSLCFAGYTKMTEKSQKADSGKEIK